METFHFGEKFFQRNNSIGNAAEHCATVKIHFEYLDFFNRDEEVFRRANNLTELGRHFLKKSSASGSKDSITIVEMKLQKLKEEALNL